MVSACIPTSISDIADKFNHTERDVMRALSYWEKLGLIRIEYDAKGEICGLQIPGQMQQSSEETETEREAGATILPLPVGAKSKQMLTSEVAEPEVDPALVKKEYTRDELKALSAQEDFSQIKFVTETYFGRPLTKTDLQSLAFIYERLEFAEDLLEYLVEYCVGKNHRDMRYIEKVAIAWKQSGIHSVRQAKLRSNRYEKIVYSVMNALGRNQNDVTEPEAEYILRWYHGYGFSEEVILYACRKCVLATEKNRIAYTDGILKSWHGKGLKTLSQIQKAESRQEAPAAQTVINASVAAKLPQNQYARRNIDYDSLEKELLKYQ